MTFSRPLLPEGASKLKLRGLAYLGNRLDIEYDATRISFMVQRTVSGEYPAAAEALFESWRRSYAIGDTAAASAAVVRGTGGRPDLRLMKAVQQPRQGSVDRAYASLSPVSQHRGRVRMGGEWLSALDLVVIDGSGVSHALQPGVPVQLSVADVLTVTAAHAKERLPMARLPIEGFDVGRWE